ncbi:MAG TPA: serine hydrolase domain-containing protein [Saprospiraceae bacterium]|nr:serine hydrolase domain-containing protein [Saprospiraceae bacterium]HMP13998.1 serine hydrolase domain-containing protein [Saprospiraceae bacterium]
MNIRKIALYRLLYLAVFVFALQYIALHSHGADNMNASNRYYHEIDQARQQLQSLLKTYPGISVAVGVGDEIVWQEGFGFANLKDRIPVTPEHQFHYYSISKSMAGLVAAKLVEEGKLLLDTTIMLYLPDLPDSYCNVTVAHLLSHTGGVRHYKKGEWMKISRQHCLNVEEALPVFINDALEFEPGNGYTYTSFGYVLLCRVLEVASGQAFDTYLQTHFLNPLGLDDIGLDQSAVAQKNPVQFYESWDGKNGKLAPPVDNSCKFGGGGYAGTAVEMVQLHQALLNGRSLQPQTVEQYFTSFSKTDGSSVEYAFGIGTKTAADGTRYFAHTGSAMGGFGVLIVVPSEKLVIVMLTNRCDDKIVPVAKDILKLFRQVV